MSLALYDIYTDEELIAQIRELHAAKLELARGGGVVRVQGEGRMTEFTRSNAADLGAELRNLLAVAAGRNLAIAGTYGNAIPVEFI